MINLPGKISHKIVDSRCTILQAMKLMDERYSKSFIVFKEQRFIGMITIGDLQRAIIAHKSFETPIAELIDNKQKNTRNLLIIKRKLGTGCSNIVQR